MVPATVLKVGANDLAISSGTGTGASAIRATQVQLGTSGTSRIIFSEPAIKFHALMAGEALQRHAKHGPGFKGLSFRSIDPEIARD